MKPGLIIFILVLCAACNGRKDVLHLNIDILNFRTDSISVFTYNENNFDPIFPLLTVKVINNIAAIEIPGIEKPERVVIKVGERLIPLLLVNKGGIVNTKLTYNKEKDNFSILVNGPNYNNVVLDSIDYVAASLPFNFKPYKHYPQFVELFSNFINRKVTSGDLQNAMDSFVDAYSEKYKKQYELNEIEKWFYQKRKEEIKLNVFYELLETGFGLQLTAEEYESDRETELLYKLNKEYSYQDSMIVWNNYWQYVENEGLSNMAIVQYLAGWFNFLVTKNNSVNEIVTLAQTPDFDQYIKKTRFPIPFSIQKSIQAYLIAERTKNKYLWLKSNGDTSGLQQISSLLLQNKYYLPFYQEMQKEHDYAYKKKKLNYSVVDPDKFSSLQEMLYAYAAQGALLIDIWAHWCAPCINEFVNESSDIETFINENKITRLYLAIGNEEKMSKEKVLKIIKKYKLNGVHFISDATFEKQIYDVLYKNEKTRSVPRYVLVAQGGTIVLDNAPWPSEKNGQALIEALKKNL